MSKKGLSFEEKKTRMLQLFYERKEFFQLKELERLAPKEKGITANSVKDVVQALLDDGSIDTDKVSGSVYFWSFPSKLINNKKRKLEDLQNQFEHSNKKLKVIRKTLEEAEADNGNEDDISDILQLIPALKKKKEELTLQLKNYKENDPEVLKEMKHNIQPVKEAANRWTDNIFSIKSWCKNKFMMEEKVLNKQFGIPEDLDYIE